MEASEQRADSRQELMLEVGRVGEPTRLGWTQNISVGGLRLACASALQTGQPVELALSFPMLLDLVPVSGEVVWSRMSDSPGVYRAGVSVQSRSDRQRLRGILENGESDALPVDSPTLKVLILDPSASPEHPSFADMNGHLRRHLGDNVVVDLQSVAYSAHALRRHAAYDMIIVDADIRDQDGAHVLTELMVGEGRRYSGAIVAASGRAASTRLAERLGCDANLNKPIDFIRWLITAGHLLQRRARMHQLRINYL